VDLRLGVILGFLMFLGALLGGRIALLLSANWLRRIYIAAVLGLRQDSCLLGHETVELACAVDAFFKARFGLC